MYSGNAGVVHDFRDFCEAMRQLKDDPRIYFLFVGDGPRRAEIEAFARTHRIANFEYRGYFKREHLRYSLCVADVHLISLRAPFVGISVPGKLYGIMASARPALFVGAENCESADTIRDARCGAVIDTSMDNAAERIAALLRECSRDRETVAAQGEAGRVALLERYEREPNCRAFVEIIRRVYASGAPQAVAPPEDQSPSGARGPQPVGAIGSD